MTTSAKKRLTKAQIAENEALERRRFEVELMEHRIQTILSEAIAGSTGYAGSFSGQNWGKLLEYFPEGATAASVQDYARGDFIPFWDNWQAHAVQRGIGRWFGWGDLVAGGMLENLTNYTIGDGLKVGIGPKRQFQNEASVEEAIEIQEAVEEVLCANCWDTQLEAETFQTEKREGDAGIWIHNDGQDIFLDLVDSSWIAEPIDPPSQIEDWKYGILNSDDRALPELFYLAPYGQLDRSGVMSKDEFWFTKDSVPSLVKRGMSVFYPGFQILERAAVLNLRMVHGASVQASIAYIRKFMGKNATPDNIRRNAERNATQKDVINRDGSVSRVNEANIRAGQIIDVGEAEFQYGPMGTPSGPVLSQVLQAGLRIAGARRSMPEYMISGDASNANYSSTLVAESPFIKACLRDQRRLRGKWKELVWKIIKLSCLIGRIPMPFGEIERRFEVTVAAADIAVRDKDKEQARRKVQHDEGMLSKRSWAAEEGIDLDEERAKLKEEREDDPPTSMLEPEQLTALLDIAAQASSKALDPDAAREIAAIAFPAVPPEALDRVFKKIKANPSEAMLSPGTTDGLEDALNPEGKKPAKPKPQKTEAKT